MPNDHILKADAPSSNELFFAETLGSFEQMTQSSSEKGKAKSLSADGVEESDGQDDSEESDGQDDGEESDGQDDGEKSGSESGDEDCDEDEVEAVGQERIDPYANWDNGEPLTADERAQLMTLSAYERSREMNIRRRKRMEADLVSDFKSLTGDLTKSLGPANHAPPPRNKSSPKLTEPRRSLRGKNM